MILPKRMLGRARALATKQYRTASAVVLATTSRPGSRGALIIPPAAPGSLGDDLLVRGAAALLGEHAPRAATWRFGDQWSIPTDSLATALLAAAQGRLHLPPSVRRDAARSWDRVVLIGADVLDGGYNLKMLAGLEILDSAARSGATTSIIGFSFNTRPRPELVDRLRGMHPSVTFFARGARSAERFTNATGRPCSVCPDLSWAHLSRERFPTPNDADDSVSSRTVGVNIGKQSCALYPEGALIAQATEVCRKLLDAGHRLVPLPHDFRGDDGDHILVAQVFDELGLDAAGSTPMPGEALRQALSGCDAVLSCRMHLSISAISQGIPVVAYGYQDKFEDLLADPEVAPLLRVVDAGSKVDVHDALLSIMKDPLDTRNARERDAMVAAKLEQLAPVRAALAEVE